MMTRLLFLRTLLAAPLAVLGIKKVAEAEPQTWRDGLPGKKPWSIPYAQEMEDDWFLGDINEILAADLEDTHPLDEVLEDLGLD